MTQLFVHSLPKLHHDTDVRGHSEVHEKLKCLQPSLNKSVARCQQRVKELVASSDAHSIYVSSLSSGNASIACPELSVILCRNERSSGVACSPSSGSCTAACLSLP